jgi:hypothetical protein
MTNAIIGGAIAAVLGAVGGAATGLLLERRREKARKLAIVEALLTEIAANLTICGSPRVREMWWLPAFRLQAYHAYEGQLLFLPTAALSRLVSAALVMEGENIIIQMRQSREGFGLPVDKESKPIPEYLTKQLEFVKDELIKWRNKHIGFLSIFRT